MEKAILKRTVDIFEKSAIASAAVGVFQEKDIGVGIAIASVLLAYFFTWLEAKK